ncbi:amidohydrolase family protein [Microbacterium sp.]|uniref:amidohydrolase family protein n=1 Tax=Microbacterium sp. TaxID=51671 RepID=UPI00281161DC|nr:amidohydrolase family protein [Microbacterium sp.]
MRVLDSHLHLWNPEALRYDWLSGPLERRFAAEELGDERLHGPEQETAVFVQAGTVAEQHVAEVRWVESIADAVGVVAIVAGARLDQGAVTEAELNELAGSARVVGVRHLLQGERDGLARSAEFVAGARSVADRGWTFDACVRQHQIADVTALAAAVPELRIVLDHLGKPVIGSVDAPVEPSAAWLGDLRELAASPQVFCKVSGLPAESGGVWTDAQVAPFLDAALDSFGADRLMWGSDWPVSAVDAAASLPGARDRWFRTVADWAVSRGVDMDGLFWGNGARFYGIP